MLARGKIASDKFIQGVRVLSREDLAVLREPRPGPTIAAVRDPHHRLARLIASGLKIIDAAPRAGYSYNRACMLMKDPSFHELIEHYRGIVTAKWAEAIDDYHEMAVTNMHKAERQLGDKLDAADEAGETLPTRDLIAISRDAADRFGYGKKLTNVNVNVDFASQLERAIKRSGKTIEGAPSNGSNNHTSPSPDSLGRPRQEHIRRRA